MHINGKRHIHIQCFPVLPGHPLTASAHPAHCVNGLMRHARVDAADHNPLVELIQLHTAQRDTLR